MARRYTPAYMQLVWAVKNRQCLIHPAWRNEVEAMIGWWLNHYKHTPIAIRCMPDHSHLLFQYHPTQSISDLCMVVKAEITKFIKAKEFCKDMDWQDGYGLFTYQQSIVPIIKTYINNQDEHHKDDYRFREEYRKMLEDAGQEYDEWYLFEDEQDWLEEE